MPGAMRSDRTAVVGPSRVLRGVLGVALVFATSALAQAQITSRVQRSDSYVRIVAPRDGTLVAGNTLTVRVDRFGPVRRFESPQIVVARSLARSALLVDRVVPPAGTVLRPDFQTRIFNGRTVSLYGLAVGTHVLRTARLDEDNRVVQAGGTVRAIVNGPSVEVDVAQLGSGRIQVVPKISGELAELRQVRVALLLDDERFVSPDEPLDPDRFIASIGLAESTELTLPDDEVHLVRLILLDEGGVPLKPRIEARRAVRAS